MAHEARPPDPSPPHFPNQGDLHAGPRYPGGGPPPPTDKRLIWGIALASGAVAYGILAAIHLSTDPSRSTAYELGRMLPVAGLGSIVVALPAQSFNLRRRLVWLLPIPVLAVTAIWYLVAEVVPDVADGARVPSTQEDDHRLVVPDEAGAWTRLDGPAARQREADYFTRLDQAPAEVKDRLEDVVYAEYRNGSSRLVFTGWHASGEFRENLRDSPEDALRGLMAGVNAEDTEFVDPGSLGGSMACAADAAGIPAGTVYCAWADGSTMGSAVVDQLDVSIHAAAEITREFRVHVTSRS